MILQSNFANLFELLLSSNIYFSSGDDFFRREIKVRTKEEEEDEIKEMDKSKDGEDDDENKDESTADNEGEEKDGEKGEGEAMSIMRFRVPRYNPDVAVGKSCGM